MSTDKIIQKTTFGGMHTRNPETKNSPAMAFLAWNVKITGESVEPMKGIKIHGNKIETAGERIKDSYTFILRDGTEIPVRIRDDKTDNILEWYDVTNDKWYILFKMVHGVNTAFQDFNTSSVDQLFIGNNVSASNYSDNYSVWSGKITRLTAAVTLHDTEINVADASDFIDAKAFLTSAVGEHDVTINVTGTSDFPDTGEIVYNGQKIAYTGKAATTFTVADAHASAGGDDVVTQGTGSIIYNGTEKAYTSVDANIFFVGDAHASAGDDDGVADILDDETYTGIDYSDIMISALNRMWLVAVDTQLSYSDEGDAGAWTPGDNRADSGVEDFPIVGGKITGLAASDEYIFIFKERTVIIFWWEYSTDTVKKIPRFKHLAIGPNMGAINHKGIANIYNEILYTSKHGIKSLNKSIETEQWRARPITDIIKPSIKNYDFSEAAAIFYPKENVFIVSCKSNSGQAANNRLICIWFYTDRDNKERAGISIANLPVDTFYVYGDELYMGSSMEGNCYKMFDGYTRAGAGFSSIYTNNRDDFGLKVIKGAQHYLIEGLIWPGTTINLKFIFDGGRLSSQLVKIKATDDCVSGADINTMGSYKLGQEIIGGLLQETDGGRPFRKVVELQDVNFFDIQVERKCTTKGGYYKIYYEGLVNPSEEYNLTPN